MKIKSINRSQVGSSDGGELLFLFIIMIFLCIAVGAILYHGGKLDGAREVQKDAVDRGYGHYTVNMDTMQPVFNWNVSTNK